MDKNEALEVLIEICSEWNKWGEYKLNPIDSMDEVADLFIYLNNQMRSGDVPSDWT